jgi:NADP-dependent aldehyde dehydrogenase
MPLTGNHLIAGGWQRAAVPSYTSVNPRTQAAGDVGFADATPAEIDAAVRAAANAFTITRRYSAEQLAGFLDAVAGEIEALGDDLLQTMDMETALGIPRATGERGRTTGQLRAFAALLREGSYVEAILDRALPDRQPAPRPDMRRMLFPIGPVAVFAPNNFPLAFGVAGGDTASAFAAGCPVIAKGHPSHPATSELVASAIQRAIAAQGFPDGFFSLLQGRSVEVGQTLILHPQLAAVGFTGSLRGGRAIYNAAATRPTPIPVYAEMGSINPSVILPGALDARLQAVVDAFVGSVTLGTGQFCTNPGLLFLLKSGQTDAFIAGMAAGMQAKAPGVLLNAGVQQSLVHSVAQAAADATVTLVTGGQVIAGDAICYANTLLQTTGSAFLSNPALQEEHFGPVTLLVVCDDLEQLQAAIDALAGNLTATVYAEADEYATAGALFDLLREKSGRLILNQVPTGVEVVHAQQHGGPYPASTAPNSTSVGMTAINRFMRPVVFQNLPDALLPPALQDANPLGIWRIVDNATTREPLG